MSKKDDCMEEQPGWYNGQFLDEVGFCCDFICRHPMVCVGGKFFSTHQYLIIKSPNMDALEAAHTTLASEVENSSRMFKRCVKLNEDATYQMLASLYKSYDPAKGR